MISATLRISVATTRKKSEVVRLLRSLLGPTQVETGCISCRLYQEIDDPKSVTWVEQWTTADALNRHLKSPRYRKILAALDMSDAKPDIRFDTVIETQGMRLIADARGAESPE